MLKIAEAITQRRTTKTL